jgi:hypothetical protein
LTPLRFNELRQSCSRAEFFDIKQILTPMCEMFSVKNENILRCKKNINSILRDIKKTSSKVSQGSCQKLKGQYHES